MNYSLAISPDLGIGAEEFSSVWNQDPASRSIAQAESAGANSEKFIGLDPELIRQGLVFLAGIAGTVTLDIVKDLIKDRIKKIFAVRSGSNAAPAFEVMVIQPGDNPLIIVMPKSKQS